ncbi:hypothetical protein KUV73_03960 [Mameliella alba]|nr:hypothetical protein [Mameliella alba]MBY6168481.1 hypothetical protein [Mameliella alba]MBY6173500.1 hypothetical protein [Mameliella alba]
MHSPYSHSGLSQVGAEHWVANVFAYIAYQVGEIKVTLSVINEREGAARNEFSLFYFFKSNTLSRTWRFRDRRACYTCARQGVDPEGIG